MPLSEHEQRMLEQIESALYAEDPKFASSVRGGRLRSTSSRRRLQAAALFAVGLFLLVAGIAAPFKPGDEIVGDEIMPQQRAIAVLAKRTVNNPLPLADLHAKAHRAVARQNLAILRHG